MNYKSNTLFYVKNKKHSIKEVPLFLMKFNSLKKYL